MVLPFGNFEILNITMTFVNWKLNVGPEISTFYILLLILFSTFSLTKSTNIAITHARKL